MSDLFFTADQHFGHKNIMNCCKRPFTSVEHMQEELIVRHNAKVPKGARVYHLGDMFWRTTPEHLALEILNRLNGTHYYVWGNHDEVLKESPALRSKFVWLKDLAMVEKQPPVHPRIILCHYAMRVWRGSHRGDWQLYGHSHAALPEINNRAFDVGVDSSPDYSPLSIEEVAARMQLKIDAGAHDPCKPMIDAQPWNKNESHGELPPPIKCGGIGCDCKTCRATDVAEMNCIRCEAGGMLLRPLLPQIPSTVWDALKQADEQVERITGAGRCIQ